jgi:hypothetical protein
MQGLPALAEDALVVLIPAHDKAVLEARIADRDHRVAVLAMPPTPDASPKIFHGYPIAHTDGSVNPMRIFS